MFDKVINDYVMLHFLCTKVYEYEILKTFSVRSY